MKKIYTIMAFLFITGIAFSQKNENPRLGTTKMQITNTEKADFSAFAFSNNSKVTSDTIGYYLFNLLFNSANYYRDRGMGANVTIDGTNYGEVNRLYQEYYFNETGDMGDYKVKELVVFFSKKYKIGATSTPSKQKVYLYKIKADSSYTALDSTSFTFNDIDTAAFFTVIPFSRNNPATLSPTCLGVAIKMVDSAGSFKANHDSAFMTCLLDPGFPKYSSFKRTDGANATGSIFFYDPHQMYTMFVVADNYVGIVGSDNFIDGMQVSQNYPNPSVDGKTTIDYAVNKPMDVSLQIVDLSGKVVAKINEGNKPAGTYKIELNQNMAKGIYYYSLIGNGQFLTKKMIIE